MADKYRSFAELSAQETEGVDFRIRTIKKDSPVLVLAPHGGEIEPGTSEIALAIAGADFSLYCFEGIIPGRLHGDLHVRSELFDEPRGRELVAASDVAIAIHGRRDGEDPNTVWAGGRDVALRNRIIQSLGAAGFKAKADDDSGISGTDPHNICNRGKRKAGVQLEIPRSLRDRLSKDEDLLAAFAAAVRSPFIPGT